MISLIPILDNGHSGLVGGQYLTPGKRSPNWSKGVLYEGMFNRWIINQLMQELDIRKVPYFHISPELEDVSRPVRIRRANKIYRNVPNTYTMSIHSNAGQGTGFEGFTSKGDTASDPIAELFLKAIEKDFPQEVMRIDTTDGDMDKEVNYDILRKTHGPAILLEILFMDREEDYLKLWCRSFQNDVVQTLANVIESIYNG